tara:strand:+ start:57 stop:2228 length:2172 start_codon:yes stop_codon:yes gene_type:complete
MLIHFAKKLTIFLKKLFSIFLIFNLTCVSTAQAAGVFVDSFSVNSEETEPRGLTFNNDGTKMFVIGWTGDDVNEYTLSTGFDVSTASFVDSFSITGTVPGGENDPRDVKFNSNGTKMFVLGRANDTVYEYTLSTGFDVSTASFVDSFDIDSEESAATSLEFNTEGTKMFVLGQNGNDVNEYTLSTGFDVSTASFVDSFDISNEETNANGLAFNRSGTRMFVTGHTGDDVNEYTLTTAFDVSTASFVDSFDISSEDTSPAAVAFNDDGTKMFVLGATGDDVNEYTISCAYKVTSSSTCDDPTTIKDVVGSIEAQTEGAKRFAKYSSGSVLKRLTFIRSHKKDGALWSVIGNSKDIDVNFSNKTLDQLTNLSPKFSVHPLQKILPEGWALWSEGSVSFGKIGETGLSSAQDIRALGITIGTDKKIDSSKTSRFFNTVYGIALRLGHDEVDIGTYGSKVDTNAISLSIYGTHYTNDSDESGFIDGVIGASYLNTDLVRKNSGDTDTNKGERDGKQIYGSIKFGREFEHNELNVTPTSRIDVSHTRLEDYTENGTEALRYDDQDINSLKGSLGVMLDRDYILETAILKHKANFEYSKDVASNSKAHSYYVSDSSKTYTYKANENSQDIFKVDFGFDYTNEKGLTLSGEFERELINDVGRTNTIFFTASFLSRKETEYLFSFNGDEESLGSSIKIAKILGPFNLGLQLENDLYSQKNNNLNLSLSSQF